MNDGEKIRVGVLRGGMSPEYNISLETGSYVLNNIPRDKYTPVDLFVDHDGVWHRNGVPINPEELSGFVDVVFNCLHGMDGEDGRVQRLLENLDIPFVGSDSFSSGLTGFKNKTKDRLKAIGYKTPQYMLLQDLSKYDPEDRHNHMRRKAMEVFKKLGGPWIVKPILGSASTHTYLVTSFSELISMLDYLSDSFDEILVEQFVEGKEIAACILAGFRGEEHYVFPPKEVVKPNKLLDQETRKSGLHKAYIIGKGMDSVKSQIEKMTRDLHKEFNLADFSMIEYIVDNRGQIHVLEIDSVPILSSGEILHDFIKSVGSSEAEFLDHLISLNVK